MKAGEREGRQVPREGWAARFHFAPKEVANQYEQEPWYFEDVTERDAEDLLGDALIES